MGCLYSGLSPRSLILNVIRRQKRHCVGFGGANRQGFRGATASVLDGAANAGKLDGCRQPSGSQSLRKAEARRGRALHPVETGEFLSLAGLRFPEIPTGRQAENFR